MVGRREKETKGGLGFATALYTALATGLAERSKKKKEKGRGAHSVPLPVRKKMRSFRARKKKESQPILFTELSDGKTLSKKRNG